MPYAYTDNWSWMSSQQHAHCEAFRKVVDVVDTLRLSIDFRKSWHWATSKAFRDFCTQLHTDKGASAQVLSVVKDLGELVHYNKPVSLGFIKDKIDEGISRIRRIWWLPCSLQKNALFVALYSSDTTYIGQNHFTKLRRAVLNSIVGDWHTASSFACCNFFSRFLVDPFLYTLCQCARILRRLATVAPEKKQKKLSPRWCSTRVQERLGLRLHASSISQMCHGPLTLMATLLALITCSAMC